MPFNTDEQLFPTPGAAPYPVGGRALYDSTDAKVTSTGLSVIAAAGGSYPTISSASADLSVFQPGQYVILSGFSAGANNVLARVHDSTTTTLRLTGGKSGSMTTEAAGQSVTIRRLRLVRPVGLADPHPGPMTLTATASANLSGTKLQLSPDDGDTWVDVPEVVLPDTQASNATTINFMVGRESLLRLTGVPATFAGQIVLT